MPEGRLCMRSNALVRMEQHLLEATVHAHALVLGQVQQESGKTFLQTHRNVHALDFDWRAGAEQMMSEGKIVPMQVPHDVVPDSVPSVFNPFGDFNALGAVKFV